MKRAEIALRDFGSIWAVGLPVCPPVHLPSLACTRTPPPEPSIPARSSPLATYACRARPSVHPSHDCGHISWQSYYYI